MIVIVGFAGMLFGSVVGYAVRDIVAYRRPFRRKMLGLDRYWRSWPAMLADLDDVSSS